MRKEDKALLIDSIAKRLEENQFIYITDISDLDAETTSNLRRTCFKNEVELMVVKNKLLKQAMERSEKDFSDLYEVLKGASSLMFAQTGNAPAKLIKEFRKENDKPILKGAFIEEDAYVGDNQLDTLASIKSKEELVADVIALLQSPAKNVISGLQSGGNILHGVLETLSERAE
jgi:large subunit ribosomal protein L10